LISNQYFGVLCTPTIITNIDWKGTRNNRSAISLPEKILKNDLRNNTQRD
jgi:hypothetical protein